MTRISFVINHPSWGSMPDKIKNICAFFSPSLTLDPQTFNTYFDNLPFITVNTLEGTGHQDGTNVIGSAETIDGVWYEKQITPLVPTADIILFCITNTDKNGHITPVGIDDKTHAIIFGQNENDRVYVNGVDIGNDFEVFCEHEISHSLYFLNGKTDRTHEFFYSGNPKGVLPDFVSLSRLDKLKSLLSYCLQLLGLLKQQQASLPPVSPPEPVPATIPPQNDTLATLVNFCQAIADYEGLAFNPNTGKPDLNHINRNPGNCVWSLVGYDPKYGNVTKNGRFAVFPTWELGMLYLENTVKQKAFQHPTWSILDYFSLSHAPASDGNDALKYSTYVSGRLGVTNSFLIKNLT